jgi:hypothetical protein
VHGADVLPDARPYLVTELCEGSLADRIARAAGWTRTR